MAHPVSFFLMSLPASLPSVEKSFRSARATVLASYLCESLSLLNAADADGNALPSFLSAQTSAYGDVYNALSKVVNALGHPMPAEVNWGGNEHYLMDLLVAIAGELDDANAG